MKKIILSFELLFGLFCNQVVGQEQQTFIFVYDKCGNIKERKIQNTQYAQKYFNKTQKIDSLESQDQAGIRVYPNPASTELHIDGLDLISPNMSNVKLQSIQGQILKSDAYHGNHNTINVSGLSNGLYLLTIQISEQKQLSYKIIISR